MMTFNEPPPTLSHSFLSRVFPYYIRTNCFRDYINKLEIAEEALKNMNMRAKAKPFPKASLIKKEFSKKGEVERATKIECDLECAYKTLSAENLEMRQEYEQLEKSIREWTKQAREARREKAITQLAIELFENYLKFPQENLKDYIIGIKKNHHSCKKALTQIYVHSVKSSIKINNEGARENSKRMKREHDNKIKAAKKALGLSETIQKPQEVPSLLEQMREEANSQQKAIEFYYDKVAQYKEDLVTRQVQNQRTRQLEQKMELTLKKVRQTKAIMQGQFR